MKKMAVVLGIISLFCLYTALEIVSVAASSDSPGSGISNIANNAQALTPTPTPTVDLGAIEYRDLGVEVTTIISQAILYTEAFVTGAGDMAAYQELLSNRLASWNSQTAVNARVTFKLPLPLEVEDILSGADISSLRYVSSPEGGGGIGYPIDDEDWALLTLMESQLKKDMGDSFKLIEGFVAAEINAQPTTLQAIAEYPEVFVVDIGAVDLLEQYPDAVVIVGNDVAYKYEKHVGSQCVIDSLLSLLDDFYAQGLIDDQAVYESLREKLVTAQRKLAQGDYEGAIADLQAFMDEVEAQSGVHIDPEAAEQLLIIADCIEVRTSTLVPEPTPTPPPTLTVDAGPDQRADEGEEISFSGTITDGLNTYTIQWDFGDGATASGTLTPTHTYADNGLYTVTLTVSVSEGAVGSDTLLVTVDNVAPVVGPMTAPMDPLAVSTTITASATFSDAGLLDTHTASWDWGDGHTSPGIVEEADGSGTVTGTHTYTTPGVYTVRLTVTDDDGDSDESTFQYIVVYDPQGGFVTGGGWIQSPQGAYRLNPSLTGKANFGFTSKYKKGANIPTGNTEFQFKVANLNFHSDTYQWLVVSGARARYKGVGAINGQGAYKFLLTAVDADINPNDSIEVDRFRIKIWVEDEQGNETVVYDNGLGAEDYPDDPTVGTTEIGGGSIVIHQD